MSIDVVPAYLREERALARSVLYRYLSTAFRHPDPSTVSDLDALADGASAAVLSLAEMGADLGPRLEALESARRAAAPGDLIRDYGALFGHSAQGKCPLYETEYGDGDEGLQQPHQLGDLSGFYAAFGLAPARRIHERFDHVAVESEFLAFLYLMEEHALGLADPERVEVAVDAEGSFLRSHLGRWGPAFARRVSEQAGGGYYRALALFALDLIGSDCRLHGVQVGPDQLVLRTIPDDPETAYDCPMSARCPAEEPAP